MLAWKNVFSKKRQAEIVVNSCVDDGIKKSVNWKKNNEIELLKDWTLQRLLLKVDGGEKWWGWGNFVVVYAQIGKAWETISTAMLSVCSLVDICYCFGVVSCLLFQDRVLKGDEKMVWMSRRQNEDRKYKRTSSYTSSRTKGFSWGCVAIGAMKKQGGKSCNVRKER